MRDAMNGKGGASQCANVRRHRTTVAERSPGKKKEFGTVIKSNVSNNMQLLTGSERREIEYKKEQETLKPPSCFLNLFYNRHLKTPPLEHYL